MRVRIIRLLRERPYNTNQLTKMLGVDYKTTEHHLRVLQENRIVTPSSDGYGAVFLLTPGMETCMPEFDEIAAKIEGGPSP